jgi:hypothetical protein
MAATTERRRAERRAPGPRAEEGGQKGANFFTKKVGPLPMWTWLALGSLAIYYYYKNKSSTSTSATSQQPSTTTPGYTSGYQGPTQTPPWWSSGAGGGGGGTGTGTTPSPAPAPAPAPALNITYPAQPAPVINLTIPATSTSPSPGNAGGSGSPAVSPGNTMTAPMAAALAQAVNYDLSPAGVTTQEQAQVTSAISNLQSNQPLSSTQQTALQTFANVQGHPVATGPATAAPVAKPAPKPGATVAKSLTPAQAQVTANVQGHAISPYAVK